MIQLTDELKVGDKVLYFPPYCKFHSERYEGVIEEIYTNKNREKRASCKLGFGRKNALLSDLVKL